MINLIPPVGRKQVLYEYWMRVSIVWIFLVVLGLGVFTVLLMPSYVLLQMQIKAYATASTEAQVEEAELLEAETEVKEANVLATHLDAPAKSASFLLMHDALESLSGSSINISRFSFSTDKDGIISITISGRADDRVALADFSNQVKDHEFFAAAEVPISNLAKDRDIDFTINVEPEVF